MNEVQNSAKERSPVAGVFTRIFRGLLCWRAMRRWLFVAACLATLIGLFYAVENWRGKRAWENCRRELEAKGGVLDWNAYIPAPVPDDQNIFKAPRMAEWFVKGSLAAAVSGGPSKSGNTNAPFGLAPHNDAKAGPVLVAEVNVVLSNAPLPPRKVDAVLRFDDPAAREQIAKLLDDIIGPWVEGAQSCVIIAQPLDQIKPANLVVQADTMPTPTALGIFLSPRPGSSKLWSAPGLSYFHVDRVGSNTFRVSLTSSVYTAPNYLALSQPAVPDLDLLRKALERPYARMDGDYQRPAERPIPNFVRQRNVAQILSQRAQCYLLLGQPEPAWHELALVREMCRMMEAKPASNCSTIVEAMIDVAISGLYVGIIQDGLRLQAWREPELTAIQTQLADLNLIQLLQASLDAQRAAICGAFETAPLPEFSWLRKRVPRGWLYQNMCAIALCEQNVHSFYAPDNQVLPGSLDRACSEMETTLNRRSPYTCLAAMVLPHWRKASQVMARNQTLANEAFIACGLERYRLAHGQYPETLDALVPQFAEKLPHDIIGGQPLKYHRTADGQFVLYSVGWNEKDDGGVPGKTDTEGDWVWRPAAGS